MARSNHISVTTQHDLTPGIPTEEYDYRRRKLMNMLPDNSIVVSVAAPIKYMSASALFSNAVSQELTSKCCRYLVSAFSTLTVLRY